MDKKFKIAMVTASSSKGKKRLLCSQQKYLKDNNIDFYLIKNNKEKLSVIYNHYINILDDKYDFLIFCHDDIKLKENECNIHDSLEYMSDNDYSIGGVAGTDQCVIKDKNLWHIMNKVKPFHGASGKVYHFIDKSLKKYALSDYGKVPNRVILLDGVFLVLDLKKIKKTKLFFDENNPSRFHFYDLDFCLTANSKKLRLTTLPIMLIHQSHGLSDITNLEWSLGNEWFRKKWGD